MQQTRKYVRLLHTADLHMGSDVYAEEAVMGLNSILDLARTQKVDAVLVAGDLFDASRISTQVVEYTFDSFAKMQCPIVVLPGNHDTLLIELSKLPVQPPSNVHVLRGQSGEMVSFDTLGFSVWGKPVYDHTPEFKPLGEPFARPSDGWYIIVAHGLLAEGIATIGRSSLITRDELQRTDCDYIALGHVHRLWNVTTGGPPAFYSGAPSGTRQPTTVIVHLVPSTGVIVEPVKL